MEYKSYAETLTEVEKLINQMNMEELKQLLEKLKENELKMVDVEIQFAKVNPTAIIPSKRDEDGCYDLYANFEENSICIEPHTVKLVPTGIASAFASTHRIAFRERGSNTKSVLQVMAGQIDSGFRGQWFVALYNGNDIPVKITKSVDEVEKSDTIISVPYTKAICQFAIEEIPRASINEITYDELKEIKSERGTGMLGSSNK